MIVTCIHVIFVYATSTRKESNEFFCDVVQVFKYYSKMIKYAEIKYKDTPDKSYIVLTENIRLSKKGDEVFNPKHENDFILNKKYYCKYTDCVSDCEEDHEHYGYYSCFIYALGDSEESLENRKIVRPKRKCMPPLRILGTSSSDEMTTRTKKSKTAVQSSIKIKKDVLLQRSTNVIQAIIDNSDSSCASYDEHHSEDRLNLKNQRPPLHNVTNIESTCIGQEKSILERVNSTQLSENCSWIKPACESAQSRLNIDDLDDDASNSNLQNNQENCQQVEIPIEPLDQSNQNGLQDNLNGGRGEKEIHIPIEPVIQNDLNDLAHVNIERPAQPNPPAGQDQAANVRLKRKNMKDWINNLISEAFNYYAENGPGHEEKIRRYTVNQNRELYLGEGIFIPSVRWNLVEVETNEVTFIRLVAVILWSNYHLVNRAVELSQVFNKNRIPGRSPVKELEYNKLRLLISLYYDYLSRRKKNKLSQIEIMQKLRESTHHLSKKIAELKAEELKRITANARRRLVLQEEN